MSVNAKRSLDLGSGPKPKNPFGAEIVLGCDLEDFGAGVHICRLGFENLPFPDSSFDFITAFDLLEHIPRTGGAGCNSNPFIFLMNEVWRCLKKSGRFYARTPAYPYPTAFSDPTHVNYITADTLWYFASEFSADGKILKDHRLELGKRYGFRGNFVAHRNWSDQAYGHQVWMLEALK